MDGIFIHGSKVPMGGMQHRHYYYAFQEQLHSLFETSGRRIYFHSPKSELMSSQTTARNNQPIFDDRIQHIVVASALRSPKIQMFDKLTF